MNTLMISANDRLTVDTWMKKTKKMREGLSFVKIQRLVTWTRENSKRS